MWSSCSLRQNNEGLGHDHFFVAKNGALELPLRKAGGSAKLAEQPETTDSILKHYLSRSMVVPDPMYLRLMEIIQCNSG
jgi:hypothetical protein